MSIVSFSEIVSNKKFVITNRVGYIEYLKEKIKVEKDPFILSLLEACLESSQTEEKDGITTC